jgi:hypothetical protein
MGYAVGALLAVLVALFARRVGLDRDRAFYPTVVIVVAAFYVLFAVMGGTTRTVLVESAVMGAFVLAAVAGFRSNLWIAAAALVGHGVFDLVHGHMIDNAGVPEWWPPFCMAYDVVAGCGLAWLLSRQAIRK